MKASQVGRWTCGTSSAETKARQPRPTHMSSPNARPTTDHALYRIFTGSKCRLLQLRLLWPLRDRALDAPLPATICPLGRSLEQHASSRNTAAAQTRAERALHQTSSGVLPGTGFSAETTESVACSAAAGSSTCCPLSARARAAPRSCGGLSPTDRAQAPAPIARVQPTPLAATRALISLAQSHPIPTSQMTSTSRELLTLQVGQSDCPPCAALPPRNWPVNNTPQSRTAPQSASRDLNNGRAASTAQQ